MAIYLPNKGGSYTHLEPMSFVKWLAKKNPTYGLYIVHSQTDPSYYRLGASGVNARDFGGSNNDKIKGLHDRLKQHLGPPSAREKCNRTEELRSWYPVWACAFSGDVNKGFTLFAEGALAYLVDATFQLGTKRGEASMFKIEPQPAKLASLREAFPGILANLAKELGVSLQFSTEEQPQEKSFPDSAKS